MEITPLAIGIAEPLSPFAYPFASIQRCVAPREIGPPLRNCVPVSCPSEAVEFAGRWRGQIVAHAATRHGRRFAVRVDYPVPSPLLRDLIEDYVTDPWIPPEWQLHTTARYAPVRVFCTDQLPLFAAVAISGLSISEIIRVVIAGRPKS